jgi:hypothetical protein
MTTNIQKEIREKFYLNKYGKGQNNDEIFELIDKFKQQEQARVIKLIDENLKNSPLLEIERRLLEELKSKIIGK